MITYKLSNTELAEMIGTTREGVNRMLSDMKKEGAVDIQGGHLLIKNTDYLRNICQCENCPKDICRM